MRRAGWGASSITKGWRRPSCAETELLREGFESNPTRLAARAAELEQLAADRLDAGQPPPLPLGAGARGINDR